MKPTIIGLFILLSLSSSGQNWINRIKDDDYSTRLAKGLNVGDIIPDVPLGDIHNKQLLVGKDKFSDFKGKLIILDFWNSWCSTCIEGFSKMSKLQELFGDQIRIILVNDFEVIDTLLSTNGRNYLDSLIPKNLVSVFTKEWLTDHELKKYFPSRETGEQVWIMNNKIELRGDPANNQPGKIREALAGKPVFCLNTANTTPVLDKTVPYYSLITDFKSTPLRLGSFFTSYNNDYDPYGFQLAKIVDSSAGTYRETYLNKEVLHYLDLCYNDVLDKIRESVICSPSLTKYGEFYILPKDPYRYTYRRVFDRIDKISLTDEHIIKSKLCYEMVVPLTLSETERRQVMLDDLKRYLNSLYKTRVELRTVKLPVYIVTTTIPSENFKSISTDPEHDVLGQINNAFYFSESLKTLLRENKKHGKPYFVLNETGFPLRKFPISMFIDLGIPDKGKGLKTVEDLRKILNMHNLDIKEDIREMKFIVITDDSN